MMSQDLDKALRSEDLRAADADGRVLTNAVRGSRHDGGRSTGDVYWFGGTHWNPVDARWEANVGFDRGNAWTFDSGVDGNREGWTGRDLTVVPPPTLPPGAPDNSDFRWVDQAKYELYGTPGTDLFPGTGDDGAIWCGKFEQEADELCWAAGQGFGNLWAHEAKKTFAYGGTGDVRLTYTYFVNTEKSFDWMRLYLEFDGVREPQHRRAYSGTLGNSVSKRADAVTIGAASIPPGTSAITTVLRFTSDSGWSDEDGILQTTYSGFCCYSFHFEDLETPSNDDEDTFENGSEGWTFVQKVPVGDFVDVTPLDALPEPAVPCSGTVLQGNALTLFDRSAGPGDPLHPVKQKAMAVSPRIDLAAAGVGDYPTKFLVTDVYADLPVANGVYMAPRLRIYPYVCPATGELIEKDVAASPALIVTVGPVCADEKVLADFSAVAADIEHCYVELEVLELCSTSEGCTTPGGNTTPWFDNVRLAVTQAPLAVGPGGEGLPAIPELVVRPNPFHPATTLEYSVPSAGAVTLRIYDTRGAFVRTIVNDAAPAGRYQATWNGRDDQGREVGSGVFWAVCRAGDREVTRRLVLLR